MKRNVLRVFTLILYLLVACTLLSAKIEEEMMLQAEVKTLKYKGVSLSFSPNVLFRDESGEHFYQAAEGTGWESGLRVREFSPNQYYYDIYDQIAFTGKPQTYRFIMSASRQPVDGEKVHIVQQFQEAEDVHLYYYADGVPDDIWLPQHASIVSQSSHMLLIRNTKARLPFFQHTAKTLSVATSQADRAYSLTEVKAFLHALPWVAALFIILLAGVVIWAMAWLAFIRPKRPWITALLMLCCLVCSAALMSQFDLPASLLPEENIFDLSHYMDTFSLILPAVNISV